MKFKPGDIVTATGNRYNFTSKSNHWTGKVTFINELGFDAITIESDDKHLMNELFSDLSYREFELAKPTIIEHLIKDNKTIVKLSNGSVGISVCAPEDEFDVYKGLQIAADRAYGKLKPFCKRKSNRNFKVGDTVRIRSWNDMAKQYGCNTSGCIKCNMVFVPNMKQYCGKRAKIIDIHKNNWIELKFEDGPESGYTFTTDMIEHV